MLLSTLLEFGCEAPQDLLAPLFASGSSRGEASELPALFTQFMGPAWRCNLEHSWVRKKFAPANAPDSGYHLQGWHQDGALGVRFPLHSGPPVPMTELLTCWVPLQACGTDSPGLEFVRRRQPGLLHFTELQDSAVRSRFNATEFWAPSMELGDGLVFLNDVLHRTHVESHMRADRMSFEYRIFPGAMA